MRWVLGVLVAFGLMAGCVVEDKPVDPELDGSVEAGDCGFCPMDRPVCLDGICVQCTADEDTFCTNRAQLCDVEAMECVNCLGDENCTALRASRCNLDTNECEPCLTNADCDGVDGLANTGNACDDGECVECTPETESATCSGGVSCNPATRTCTETQVGSLRVCEPCLADSECGSGGAPSTAHRCVPMFYPDPQTRFPDDETGFCLKTTDGGCERPYSITLSGRSSLSGSARSDYCGINESLATCPAVRALEEDTRCDGGADEECPVSGLCRQVGSLLNRCTYRCSFLVECLPEPLPGATCDSDADDEDYCGGRL